MQDLSGTILVLGLGASGEAVAEWALGEAAGGRDLSVVVVDSATNALLEERARRLAARGADVRLGTDEVPEADLVVASPGIKPTSALMRAAHALGVPVISEVELAYRISSARWVAVTGTNGKSTTTALIAHLLREAGISAEPVGNFGPPAVSAAARAAAGTVLVAEVSSFQLSLVQTFHPAVSVLLNITPDHLDYHGSFEAYAEAKASVFANQGPGDTAVIDVDDRGSAALVSAAGRGGARVCQVSLGWRPPAGAYLADGMLVLEAAGSRVELVPRDALAIRGDHNVSNALAAAAAAWAMGADPEAVRRGLVSFRPIEHRLEPVGVVDGAEYFNDSKATNPDAVLKALTAFDDRPVILLLGGRNKGVPLRELAEIAAARCRAVVLFGEAAGEFEQAFEGLAIERAVARGLDGAVEAARRIARSGDAVVLSPGCASFDEFTDYAARGHRFRELVRAMQRGGVR